LVKEIVCHLLIHYACCDFFYVNGYFRGTFLIHCFALKFFVASDPQVKDDRLWHDKYSLRAEMVPSFLSVEQAKKVQFFHECCAYLWL
jgi:hypothetical protein